MADNKDMHSDENECTVSCDSEFVDCVESWRQDCLVKFRNCESTCET